METEEQERIRKELELYRGSEVVKKCGFEEVPVTITGIGDVIDYLNNQDPEEESCMNIYKQKKKGELKADKFGYPKIKNALNLVVEAYKESDVASFVGISSRDMGNTHSGMYFRLFFRPQKREDSHYADEDLYQGIGATKAYEIVCDEFCGRNYEPKTTAENLEGLLQKVRGLVNEKTGGGE